MAQVGSSLGLLAEPGHEGFVTGKLAVEDLDGNLAIEHLVGRLKHIRHTASGDVGDKLVSVREGTSLLHGVPEI